MSDTGTVRVDIEIENPVNPGARRVVSNGLVGTGAALTWLPEDVLESLGIERYTQWHFRRPNGTRFERWVGSAFVYVNGRRTADDVVFGEPGDPVLLGTRSLRGFNLRVEPASKRLVDAGPAPAAGMHGDQHATV